VKYGGNMKYLVALYQRRTLDSETLAEGIGAGHHNARSNRTQAWLTTPNMFVNTDHITMAAEQANPTLTREEKRVIRGFRAYDMLPE
jgi:hypothetical protein